MTLERITVQGFMRFTAPAALDLAALPPGLIAIVGANGEGKSTLLEAGVAALYRSWVSRGDLADYATGKDSYLEAVYAVDGAGRYRARVNVDGIRRASDAVLEVTPAGGAAALLNDGKATTYDQAIRRIFPSAALLQASAFAAQNKAGDFITAKPAQRRELLGELLGLGAVTSMGATARTIAGLTQQTRDRLRAGAEILRRDAGPDVPERLARLEARTRQMVDEDTTAKGALQLQIDDLEARLATRGDAVAAHGAAQQRVLALEREQQTLQLDLATIARDVVAVGRRLADEQSRLTDRRQAALDDLATKLAGNRSLQAQAAAIRAAVTTVATCDAQIAEQTRELETQRAADAADLQALRDVEREIAALAPIEGQIARARTDAGLLAQVPCGGAGAYADCQLLVNAQQAKASLEQLVAQLAPKAALAERVAALTRTRADRAIAITTLQDDLTDVGRRRAGAVPSAAYAAKLDAAEQRIQELERTKGDVEQQTTSDLLEAQRRHDQDARDLEDRRAVKQARLDALAPELAAAVAERTRLEAGQVEVTGLQRDLKAARQAWDVLTSRLAQHESFLRDTARDRATWDTRCAELADVERRIAILDQTLVEWDLLARALGKEGVPELEIDAAGPTISAYTNELLAVCHGTRFSLDLVTQVARADGKGMKDQLTVQVLDNRAGGVARDIADLSGGEQVIVSEALRNAIGVYCNRRSPMPVRTCWRDETVGALDPENAFRYVAMLRKVLELGGYHQILLVSHNLDVAAACDAQVRVRDGRLDTILPPYASAA